MKVYTKTGDEGKTSLFNGDRVPKDDARVRAYLLSGELANWSRSAEDRDRLEELLRQLNYIQNRFFDLGAHLATPRTTSDEDAIKRTEFKEEAAETLEGWIDELDVPLARLTTFILPGGHTAAAQLHVARSTARRAESMATPLIEAGEVEKPAFMFMNRVSDYFFVAARYANMIFGYEDLGWKKLD